MGETGLASDQKNKKQKNNLTFPGSILLLVTPMVIRLCFRGLGAIMLGAINPIENRIGARA